MNLKLNIAVLDMYNGFVNEGMRCIKKICENFASTQEIEITYTIFDIRQKNQWPDIQAYDIFISSGGPGNPLPQGNDWEPNFGLFLEAIIEYNKTSESKKFLFLICHSFELATIYLEFGKVCKRKSTSFGVMPIHKTELGLKEPFFQNLPPIFHAVDSRDYQLIKLNYQKINEFGAKILCIEKERPQIKLERAVMAIRFTDEIIGTQFHPEADSEGMLHHFKQDEKRIAIINEHGLEKYNDMIDHLDDPDKIRLTEAEILPAILHQAMEQLMVMA